MNRKQFIQSHGATCQNWTWSWSFVNASRKFVIFGVWDTHDDGRKALILSESWQTSRRGKKQAAYGQSREHIRLVEEAGYTLMTFPMIYSAAREENGTGPAKIQGFTPQLSTKNLHRIGASWFAADDEVVPSLPEEVGMAESLVEGAASTVVVNAYERNAVARRRCLEHHGYSCKVCGFNFEQAYGEIGKGFIHVHHIVPLHTIKASYQVDPINDLVPVCPNCHAMIHSTRPPQAMDELRQVLAARCS